MPADLKIRLTADTAQAEGALGSFLSRLRQVEQLNQRIGAGARVFNQALVAGAALVGASALRRYTQEALAAARGQAQLAAALRSSGQFTQDFVRELTAVQEELKRTIGADEDTTRAVQRLLITFGIGRRELPELTERVFDLAAALGMDALSAAQALGRALAGEDVTGGRLRLEIDRTLPKAQQLAQALDQLRTRYAGQAAAAFRDAAPEVQRFSLALGDARKAIGAVVLAIAGPFLDGFTRGIERLRQLADAARDAFASVDGLLGRLSRALGEWSGRHLPAILGLLAGLVALRAAFWLAAIPVNLLRSAFVLLSGQAIGQSLVSLQALSARISATTLLTGQLTRSLASLRAVLLTLPGALATAGAALAGVIAGDFLNELEVTSGGVKLKIAQWAQLMSVELMRAWAQVRAKLGLISQEQLAAIQKNLDETAFRLQFPGVEPGRITPRARTPAPAAPERSLAEQLAELRRRAQPGIEQAAQPAFQAALQAGLADLDRAFERGLISLRVYVAERQRLINFAAHREIAILTQAQALVQKDLVSLAEQTEALLKEADTPDTRRQLLELERQRLELKREEAELTARIQAAEIQRQADLRTEAARLPAGFSGELVAGLKGMLDQLGTAAQNAAAIVTNTLGAAFQSISQTLTNLIMGTITWGQALYQIATQILSTLLNSVINFFVNLIARAVLNALIGTAVQQAAAAAAAASWAGPAILASVATFGAAAAQAPASVAAALATAPALATMSLATGAGGFARGGFTGEGPRDAVAGLVHRGEWVMPADTVRAWGRDVMAAIQAGPERAALDGIVPQPSGGRLNLLLVDSRQSAAARAFLESTEGRALIVDLVRQHRLEAGIPV